MIDLQTAYEIALSEVYIPDDALLVYSNLLSGRYVFEWKHTTDEILSENDRVLIWVDPLTGNVLLTDIVWKDLKFPIIQIQSIKSMYPHLEIIGYHEIAKQAYFTYDGTPLKDWYWIGSDLSTNYIIDEYGIIVGQMIPIPRGCSLSGHFDNSKNTGCWNTSFYANHFSNWTNTTIEQSCGTAITGTIYNEIVSDPNTVLYQCTAHGGYAGFRFHSELYIRVATVTNIMQDRPPLPFAILTHCNAMDSTGSGTLSYAYRKGQTNNTITVGLKHTTNESWSTYLSSFRGAFYSNINDNTELPIKTAYDDAMAFVPTIDGHYEFVGDTSLCINDIIARPSCKFGVI